MKVFNLRCPHDHRFEGWFASEAERQRQLSEGLLTCPVCGDAEVAVLPSAPRVQVGRAVASRDEAAVSLSTSSSSSSSSSSGVPVSPDVHSRAQAMASTLQTVWRQAVQHVLARTEDVGDRFAEEARRIHRGEAEERGIRGKATRDEAEALRDEGIEVVPLPEVVDKGTLQ